MAFLFDLPEGCRRHPGLACSQILKCFALFSSQIFQGKILECASVFQRKIAVGDLAFWRAILRNFLSGNLFRPFWKNFPKINFWNINRFFGHFSDFFQKSEKQPLPLEKWFPFFKRVIFVGMALRVGIFEVQNTSKTQSENLPLRRVLF